MTFTEVVDAVTRHTCKFYVRPVHWRGYGVAYSLQEGRFFYIPAWADHALIPGPAVTLEDYGYEWEMVDVATIRAEKDRK